MNRELINKYKDEFDYWLNGGNLLLLWSDISDNVRCWVREDSVCTNNLWTQNLDDIKSVIINDKYVEFRKALVGGKTIQTSHHFTGEPRSEYYDCNFLSIINETEVDLVEAEDLIFRIKPDEPEFKVGDWVTCEMGGTKPYKIINETILKYCTNGSRKNVKLWEPQKGEWCWFYELENNPILARYNKFINGEYEALAIDPNRRLLGHFGFCEPFIGQLPSFVKEQQ